MLEYLSSFMNDLKLKFYDYGRTYLSEDVLMYASLVAGFFGFIFMLISIFSMLRINRAMKRDGLETPALHFMNIIFYWEILSASRRSAAKKIRAEQKHGVTDGSAFLSFFQIQPYIKPIDRFMPRAFLTLTLMCFLLLFVAEFLYP